MGPQPTMRFACLIAVVCVVAATASFSEDQFREDLPDEALVEEFTENQGPVAVPAGTIKKSETLTETQATHKHHGRTRWRWGRYRRIGIHRYRHRKLYRNV